jgi:hypothetical protein
MPFMWSEHASHVTSLYRPWRPGDGYPAEVILKAEASLGIRLPKTLCAFYQSWGAREDLTQIRDTLLAPQELTFHSDALVFCTENQSVLYWAILQQSLAEDNPPVHFAEVTWGQSNDQPEIGPWQMSHERVSDFLDALAYGHAFAGGALHGGRSHEPVDERRVELLQQNWQQVKIRSVRWGFIPDPVAERSWPLYIRDGQAIDWFWHFSAAVHAPNDLDEIAQILGLTWAVKH